MIHVIGDLVQNIGVMIAAVLIYFNPKYMIADPICTVLFSFLVVYSTIGTIKQGMRQILNSTPGNVDVHNIAADLKLIVGVINVHDLHVWNISSGRLALIVHLVVDSESNKQSALRAALKVMNLHHIRHSTIQIEEKGCDLCYCYKFNDTCDLTDSRSGSISKKTVKIERIAPPHSPHL